MNGLLIGLFGYGLGAFPSAYLIARRRGVDIFSEGSGNMGSTNVLRSLGMAAALLVFGLDVAKGVLVVLLVQASGLPLLLALTALIGHCWSLAAWWATGQLRGGKGVATLLGVWLIVLPPLAMAGVLAAATLLLLATRKVSLAALGALGLGALGTLGGSWLSVLTFSSFWLVVYRHRENLWRLWQGSERMLDKTTVQRVAVLGGCASGLLALGALR